MKRSQDTQWAIDRIYYGSSDTQPTRRIYFKDDHALETDTWWHNYFLRERELTKENAKIVLEYIEQLEARIQELERTQNVETKSV